MTDSHIPNSKAAPDWRELPYERTSFDNAIELTIVKGFVGRYSGFATQDWCTPHDAGPSLHGGYISSIFIAGSRKYFRSQQGNLNQPDPTTMHVQFLQLVPQGSFHVVFEDLKLGHRQSTIQGKILSSDLNIHTIYTLAIITMGDLNSNVGISISLPPIPTPNRERDCTRWTSGFFYHINPPSSACRCYNPKDGPDIMWSPKLGRNKRDQWNKLDNEDNIRLEHLGLIADLIPGIPLNYEKSALKGVLKYEFPTLSMSFEFRSDPAARKEWILNRTVMHKLHNGRFDMDVQMIDDDGDLVATVRHSCSMFPHKRGKKAMQKASML